MTATYFIPSSYNSRWFLCSYPFLRASLVSNMSTLQGANTTASTSSFITALVLNGAIFAAEIILFSILRPRFQVKHHCSSSVYRTDTNSHLYSMYTHRERLLLWLGTTYTHSNKLAPFLTLLKLQQTSRPNASWFIYVAMGSIQLGP